MPESHKSAADPLGWLLKEKVRIWILAITFPIALLLGTVGYLHYPAGEAISFSNALYHSAQLFILHTPHFIEPVPLTLEIGRWLAALSTILALFTTAIYLIRDEKEELEIRFIKGHIILCGMGEIALALANNFSNKKKLVVIEKNIDNENLSNLKKQGVKVFKGNALDPEVLKKVRIEHASNLYALTGDDFSNLTIIKNVKALLKNSGKDHENLRLAANIDSLNLKAAAQQEISFCNKLVCHLSEILEAFRKDAEEVVNGSSPTKVQLEKAKQELLQYVPASSPDAVDPGKQIRFFNINELAARYIFREYPPNRFKSLTNPAARPIHILLLGLSQMGEELFKLCVQNCHFINRDHTQITHISLEADIACQKVQSKHKNIKNLVDLKFIKFNPHHITNSFIAEHDLNNIDIIYICSDQDRYQESYSVKAREVFGKKVPIIRWFTRDVITDSDHNQASNTKTIEILRSIAKHEIIINETIDQKAIAIHNRWLKRAIGEYIQKVEKQIENKQEISSYKPTLAPWHLLDEEIRDDNRSVVEHNLIKLRTVGQLNNPEDFLNPEMAKVDFKFLNDDSAIENLAEMEHRRWMANKYYYGWEFDEERNDGLKRHNDLKDFSALDFSTKDYDYKQIKELQEVWEVK